MIHQSESLSDIPRVIYLYLYVADVLSGYNGTIFAYGQTSSGKTHTMEVSDRTLSMLHSFFQGRGRVIVLLLFVCPSVHHIQKIDKSNLQLLPVW